MAIVSIFSGTFCNAEEVAEGVAPKLGYKSIDRKLLELTSQRYGVPREKLRRAMEGSPPLFNKLTREREKNLAYLKLALGQLIESDDVVCSGFAGLLLPRRISHMLRVCLIANLTYRVAVAVEVEKVSERQALKWIREEDNRRARWTQYLFGKEPYEEDLYDVVLPMQSVTVDEAIEKICLYSRQPAVRTVESSRQAVHDFKLAGEVNLLLAERGHDVNVRSSDGHVSITINRYVVRLERYKAVLEELALKVPGVRSVTSAPGTQFVPPPLTRSLDIEGPSKVLLVDDEHEFVQTLSQRLQTRNLDSSVVYDGEEALSFIETEEPEVIVLDLKMPGIDGMEVLRRVKRDYPKIEVIILTGHGSDKEERFAKALGAFAYLHKPVDVDLVAETMKAAYRKIREEEPTEQIPGE